MEQNQKIIKTVTVAVIIFITLLLFALIINFVKLHQTSSAEDELKTSIASLQSEIDINDQEIEYLSSDEHIERYNREVLHRKMKDEKVYRGK